MTFLSYLKYEIRFAILLASVVGASYYTSLYFGWSQLTVITNQDIGIYLLVFILLGSFLTYVLQMPPRNT